MECSPVCISSHPTCVHDSSFFINCSALSHEYLADLIIENHLGEVWECNDSKVWWGQCSCAESLVEWFAVSYQHSKANLLEQSCVQMPVDHCLMTYGQYSGLAIDDVGPLIDDYSNEERSLRIENWLNSVADLGVSKTRNSPVLGNAFIIRIPSAFAEVHGVKTSVEQTGIHGVSIGSGPLNLA